jgi:alpha-ketoglutarate-dependent taurine dioxygenase
MQQSLNVGSTPSAASTLPVVLELEAAPGDALRVAAQQRKTVETALALHGAVLLRGLALAGTAEFRGLVESYDRALLEYDFASTPRTELGGGVYTSTEYPAHQAIPLHNEQSYARTWPLRLWFFCEVAPQSGGCTPLGDSRAIHDALPARLRARFEGRGIQYVRNYGGGLDLPWARVFRSADRQTVERYCRENGIACEWKADGGLRTRQTSQAMLRHPTTGAWLWFNQAHLFHVSSLAADVREALLELVAAPDLPRNAYYGDGAAIEDEVLDEIRAVLRAHERTFDWRRGDVLLVDNMAVAHAREPFSGPRKVSVAMTEPCSVRHRS